MASNLSIERIPAGKFSRVNLQSVVTPPANDESGTDPYLSVLDGNTVQFMRSLRDGQIHVVVANDVGDLPALSFRYYKNINGWWIIGMYNGIFDPFTDMYPGQRLKIPSLDSIEAYFRAAKDSQRAQVDASNPQVVYLP